MHTRQIYSYLDWIGDIGGLVDGLKLLGALLVFVAKLLIGNPFKIFILQRLYKSDD